MSCTIDGYCSTLQELLDWVEVDLGFTKLLFMHRIIGLKRREYHKPHKDSSD